MLAPIRIAAPAALAVSLDEAKEHLRVIERDGAGAALPNEDDDLIEAYVAAATDHLDGYTGILGRALVTQSWRQAFAGFGCMRLPLGPAVSIADIKYFDGSGAQQTLPDTVYDLFADARGPYVGLKPGQQWPPTFGRPDAVSVTYVAGGAPADVPAAIKVAIMLMVANWYQNAEAVSETGKIELPIGAYALIAPYRRMSV
jgi:uncharacterized phiE125 gp8 family phage protein